MCNAWFMAWFLAPGIREISWSTLAVCVLVPPLWLCPGTGWLLSPCLTNLAPLLQISLLPIPVDIMRADLQAARGVCVWECQCLCMCELLVVQRDGEERILKRLEIYWLPFAVSLPLCLHSLPPSSLGPFSSSLFIEGCRGQCFCLCSI